MLSCNYGQQLKSQRFSTSIQPTIAAIFPDSTVKVLLSNLSTPLFHSVGMVIDPKSYVYIDPLSIWHPYSWDSIDMPFHYKRGTDSFFSATANRMVEVVDTVIVQYLTSNQITKTSIANSTSPAVAVAFDTALVRCPAYAKQDTILLRSGDTSGNGNTYWTIARRKVGLSLNPGEIVGATMTFYPGYPYQTGDTLVIDNKQPTKRLNRFEVLYWVDNSRFIDENTWNLGLEARKENRYLITTNPWIKQYTPTTAWVASGFKHFDFTFFLSTDKALGLNDETSIAQFQVYPNPLMQGESLRLSFQSLVEQTLYYTISDMSGQLVVLSPPLTVAAGQHSFELDTQKLLAGVYTCTLISVTGATHLKLIIR